MSYEIVMGIRFKVEEKEVWIKSDSNNVSPRNFRWNKWESLSTLYKEKGKESVMKRILKLYWEGSFQPGTKNKYSESLEFLKALNKDIAWAHVGPVKHLELVSCPLEDLALHINSYDEKVLDIISRRLQGEIIDPASIKDPVLYTEEELKDLLYKNLLKMNKRKKGTWVLDGMYQNITFKSYKEAVLYCYHGFLDVNCIEEITLT
jgi:hypothetical protein